MSESTGKAVFLSYASQDAKPATRICEALRAAGIEVWFDQDALVGGDAWDQKIRGQISSCALFIPVVSANTQAREEGYFRLEWKLAEDRSHLMAKGKAFIVPVTIDGTTERGAEVPDAFLRVQWTKLPGGETSAAFVARVKKLLGGPSESISVASSAAPQSAAVAPARKSSPLAWAVVSLGVIALALVAFMVMRPAGKQASSAPKPVFQSKTGSATPTADASSVAVLPFVNMSSDKENEYLSDGLTEEILNVLAKVPGLRVPARTSSFVFKGKTDDIKKISELLRVATVLEGSVQRSGNQLRVTAQLINVADGYHLWSERYDREMTNIFAIQDDIARTIVAKLKVTLAGLAGLPVAKRGTENVEAYELVLKGKFYAENFTEFGYNQAIDCFTRAVALQPDYALAYAKLARTYSSLSFYGYVPPESVRQQRRAALAKALQLDETLAEAHVALAASNFYNEWDWSAAEREFKRALELEPENVSVRQQFAMYLSMKGRYPEAVAESQKALQLDPLSVHTMTNVGWVFYFGGNFDRAVEAGREAVAFAPDNWRTHFMNGRALFMKGHREAGIGELEESYRLAPVSQARESLGAMYAQVGRKSDAERILEELLVQAKQRYVSAFAIAYVYAGLGNIEQTDVWMRKAIDNRESRLVMLKVGYHEALHTNPHYPEWLKQIGLDW